MAFLFEAIDEHPVITGHGLDFVDGDGVERLQGLCRLQAVQHLAQIAGAAIVRSGFEILEPWFEFQH